MKDLTTAEINLLLEVLYPIECSTYFWEDNNGKTEPKETPKSKAKDKLLSQVINKLKNSLK